MRKTMRDTARNVRGKVFGARIENAEIIPNRNKMHLSLLLRSMDGEFLLMI